MKVGIISMQRVVNYGSFLQAYSLKNTIEKLGHDVEFVDYMVEKPVVEGVQEESNETVKKDGFCKKAVRYAWEHRSKKSRKLRNFYRAKMYLTQRYNDEFLPLLGISSEYKYNTNEDVIVIGSDEVFNCLQSNKDVGYSKELFGADANAEKVISYAASFGTTTVEGLDQYKIKDEIAQHLKKFDAISVRDVNSIEVIKNLLNVEPYYHIDPVLLSDYEGLIPDKVDLINYMIVYAYGHRITEEEAQAINEFANKKNLKVVTIGETNRFEWDHLLLTPFEVLAYFKNAEYIVTDTFHGTIFSLKYSKQFATIIRESNKQKLSDLLNRFELTERTVTDIKNLENVLNVVTDYSKVQSKIVNCRKESIEYLSKYIGKKD